MTQATMIAAIAQHSGQSLKVVTDVLGSLGEQVQAALGKGEEVFLPHIGKLKPKTRAARDARNPKTGEAVKVPAKTVVKFVAGKDLRDSLPKPKRVK